MLLATVVDLDETLADSATTWTEVIGAVADRHGHAWTADDWAAIRGTSTASWSAYLARRCPNLTPEAAAADCVDGMVDAVQQGRFGLLPGAADLIATAAGLGPVALVSASPERYVQAAITALGLDAHLRAAVSGDDVTNGKPAPDPYLLAAFRLGVHARQCVAIEDSGSGIRSAHAAGMTVLAVPNPTTALDLDVLALAAHQATDAHIAAKTLLTLLG